MNKPSPTPQADWLASGDRRSALTTIDSHTSGQQTRTIVDGLPPLKGSSLHQMRDNLASEHDWVRRVASLEPRGHASMFVAALVPPVDSSCASGVIFMDAAGYHDMCGHAIIGVATTLLNLGYVESRKGEANFAIETPAGRIDIRAQVKDGRASRVTFRNQAAYYLQSVPVATPTGEITEALIAYGGQWYAFVDTSAYGLEIDPKTIDHLVAAARQVRAEVLGNVSHPDPQTGIVPTVSNVVWCGQPSGPETDARNVPINQAGGFDRSPCGTATSARMAILHAEGSLARNQTFVNEGLLSTLYRGWIVNEVNVNGHPAVVAEVEGSAWLTGRYEIWIDDTDPLWNGFLLG